MNKKIITLLSFLFIFSSTLTAREKSNVTLTLHLDPFINEVEQMIYVYYRGHMNSGVYDSVKVVPGKSVYTLHGYVPFEDIMCVTFSKRGPGRMKILAHPGEHIEMEITENDHKMTVYKEFLKGSAQNDTLAKMWNAIFALVPQRMKLENSMSVYGLSQDSIRKLQDGIKRIEKMQGEIYKNELINSNSPYIVYDALKMSRLHTDSLEYESLKEMAFKKFPDYLPLQWLKAGKYPVDPAERETNILMSKVIMSRIAVEPQVEASDSVKIGEKPDIALVDTLGNTASLEAFRGRFVLIEMWASWCIPCIQAMPNILHAQEIFAKDFVCCAISIDKEERRWKNIIKEAELEALHHYKGTDDKGEANDDIRRLISKGTIPQNYLLDREGKVIAINIYGEELIKKLETLTKE